MLRVLHLGEAVLLLLGQRAPVAVDVVIILALLPVEAGRRREVGAPAPGDVVPPDAAQFRRRFIGREAGEADQLRAKFTPFLGLRERGFLRR
ncbi:hypothetical protein [Sphingobium amiense]|uniref:hypothetical protein n=1 Tax=Sphingobium amiense TaxID=135719 RepID=UPI002F928390